MRLSELFSLRLLYEGYTDQASCLRFPMRGKYLMPDLEKIANHVNGLTERKLIDHVSMYPLDRKVAEIIG